ncbi:MAG: DUF6242 domain-containing protein [Candidatus Saccharimonadaceae bacterium]
MISNWFYYCVALLAITFTLSSCLSSDEKEIILSPDAQITSFRLSSSEDSLKALSKIDFSINQVSSAPFIFNKDSLPYLMDLEKVLMTVTDNGASGIKLYLINPDSSYIWNKTDSVMIKKLKQIEMFAQDGKTTKRYTFQLNIHQQDPDTILWQNVKNNYIISPTDQVTVSNKKQFFTYYSSANSIKLSTSLVTDGTSWTNQVVSGLPQNVILKSIQIVVFDSIETWYALDSNNNVYTSTDGFSWAKRSTSFPVKTIYGKLPSFSKDSILAIVKDGTTYKFAKTKDFSSMRVLNEIPAGFPVEGASFTTLNDPLIYSAKYFITTGGQSSNGLTNNSVWLLQESDNQITFTSKILKFNVTGASLFNYDNKIYMLTTEDNKNVFYTSSNYGIFWEKANNKQTLPSGFTKRTNQSVNVDNKNNVWIFGGTTDNQTQLKDVWKGRINKLFQK